MTGPTARTPPTCAPLDVRAPPQATDSPAFARYVSLTMPPGAMATLFEPVLRILASPASISSASTGGIAPAAFLFAGDHSVAKNKAVSAFPCEVTAQMVANFLAGGAAMSVLARRRGMRLVVCDVGVATPLPNLASKTSDATFLDWNVPREKRGVGEYPFGSRDISEENALDFDDHLSVFERGRALAQEAVSRHGVNLLVLGEMGIGNTTPATAIASVLLREDPSSITGVGTGLNIHARRHKTDVVRRCVARFRSKLPTVALQFSQGRPVLEDAHLLLAGLGGFELSAMAGAACGAAEAGCYVVLDGVICTAAIAPFAIAVPSLAPWLIAGHRSAEPAHGKLLSHLALSPLVDLNLRLGEGSGAAMAVGLLQDALALLDTMATFSDAGVSGG
ncbi:MAG: nicotinate-nucleotide--dimethylbenzimidazole phosphoribosyltransferase [Silvanigrellales bacterium]|jgi:nicotinate-nucleotide--dimethylbenzimidazole phosphoribosyltransferase|nr:nicotinate-nucleotide--dimethylbenzimidazole phosphoribosyltransferase [Silvanigrellales bacterium]